MAKIVRVGDSVDVYAALLTSRADWRTSNNSTRGVAYSESTGGLGVFPGALPEPHRAKWFADTPVYVVWSYETPIAWLTGEGAWYVPDVAYSPTTNGHQHNILAALRTLGVPFEQGEHVNLRKGQGTGRTMFGPRRW